jgi:hypothetical protein
LDVGILAVFSHSSDEMNAGGDWKR